MQDGGSTARPASTGLAVVVDFVFPAGTTLPDTLIWGIAYNTESSGYDPSARRGRTTP